MLQYRFTHTHSMSRLLVHESCTAHATCETKAAHAYQHPYTPYSTLPGTNKNFCLSATESCLLIGEIYGYARSFVKRKASFDMTLKYAKNDDQYHWHY